MGVCMCGCFGNMWLCVSVGFVMCGYVNVWVCVCLGFVMCEYVNVWVCVCVGFVMCGCMCGVFW